MLELVLGAGLVVKAVLLLLAFLSVASWAVMAYKSRELGRAERDTRAFLSAYHEQPMDAAYHVATRRGKSPLAAMFSAGYRDQAALRRLGKDESFSRDAIQEIIARLGWIQAQELQRLDRGVQFLATTGSSAPFIGLFGTVIGIMNAFRDIGVSGSASLAVVAPGIAEALVATAVGLFAAIPAVMGYNAARVRLGRLQTQLDAFRDELGEALRRSVGGGR
jgi:biopolymer transport protein TolQ